MAPRKPAKARHTYAERVVKALSRHTSVYKHHSIHPNTLRKQIRDIAKSSDEKLGPNASVYISKAIHNLEQQGAIEHHHDHIALTPEAKKFLTTTRHSLGMGAADKSPAKESMALHRFSKEFGGRGLKRKRLSSRAQSNDESVDVDEVLGTSRGKRRRPSASPGKRSPSKMTRGELLEERKRLLETISANHYVLESPRPDGIRGLSTIPNSFPARPHTHAPEPRSIPRRLTRTQSGSWRNAISLYPTPAPSDSGSSALTPLPEDRSSPQPRDPFIFVQQDDFDMQDDYVGDIFDEDLQRATISQPIQQEPSFQSITLTPPSSVRRKTLSSIDSNEDIEEVSGPYTQNANLLSQTAKLQARLVELEVLIAKASAGDESSNDKIHSLEEQAHALEELNADGELEISQLQEELTLQRSEVAALRLQLSTASDLATGLQGDVQTAKHTYDVRMAEKDAHTRVVEGELRRRVAGLEGEKFEYITRSREEHDRFSQLLDDAHASAARLEEELARSHITITSFKQRLAEEETVKARMETAEESFQQQLEQCYTRITELDSLHQSITTQLKNEQQTVAYQAVALSNLKGRCGTVMRELECLDEVHTAKLLEHERLKERFSGSEARIQELISTMAEKEATYDSAITVLKQHVDEAQGQTERLETSDRDLRAHFEDSQIHANGLESTIEALETNIARLQSTLTILMPDFAASKSIEESTKASLAIAEAQVTRLSQQCRLRESDIASLEAAVEDKVSQVTTLQKSLDDCMSTVVHLKSEVAGRTQKLEEVSTQRDSLRVELETARGAIRQLQVDIDNTLRRAQAAEEDLEDLKETQRTRVERLKKMLRQSLAHQEEEMDFILSNGNVHDRPRDSGIGLFDD